MYQGIEHADVSKSLDFIFNDGIYLTKQTKCKGCHASMREEIEKHFRLVAKR